MVAAFRSEEVPPDHPLRALNSAAHLKLPTFPASNVRKLVESMAGPLPGEAVDVIERLAEGSPFMAAAAVRGLVESGALVPALDHTSGNGTRAWRASNRWRWPMCSPPGTPPRSSRGGSNCCPRPPSNCSRLARCWARSLTCSPRRSWRGKLRHKRLPRCARRSSGTSSGPKSRMTDVRSFTTSSARPCSIVCRSTSCKELHLRAALDLEAEAPDRVYDLAYHFDAAGESQRALPYALAAAEDARTASCVGACRRAVSHRGTRRAGRGRSNSVSYRRRLGDVLMLRGRYEAGGEDVSTAASLLAKDNLTRAQIEGKLGELAFKQGDIQTAIEAIERALGLLGHQDAAMVSCVLASTRLGSVRASLAYDAAHSVCGSQDTAGRRAGTPRHSPAINRLTYAYWFGRGKIPACGRTCAA